MAQAIFDTIDAGQEDISPDPLSASVAGGWNTGVAKGLERQNTAYLPPQPSGA